MANKGKWRKRKKAQVPHQAKKRAHLARNIRRGAAVFGRARGSGDRDLEANSIDEEDLATSDRPAAEDPTGRRQRDAWRRSDSRKGQDRESS
jgi:hypothetical protein